MTQRNNKSAPWPTFSLAGSSLPVSPAPPGLYIVATPIGNLDDITLRALHILAGVCTIICEDKRVTARLLERYAIHTPLVAYHDHNGPRVRPRLLEMLAAGAALALVSDAGTPLISDPGHRLVAEAVSAGHKIIPLPGPSAAIAALSASGLASDRFFFAGFPPRKKTARRSWLAPLAPLPATLVLYESIHRLGDLIEDAGAVLGMHRRAAIARELTKTFEQFIRAPLGQLPRQLRDMPQKGEIVLLIEKQPDGHPGSHDETDQALHGGHEDHGETDRLLQQAMAELPLSGAVRRVARACGKSRQLLYQRALQMRDGNG